LGFFSIGGLGLRIRKAVVSQAPGALVIISFILRIEYYNAGFYLDADNNWQTFYSV